MRPTTASTAASKCVPGDDEPGGDGATLAGVGHHAEAGAGRGLGDVDVVEHDRGGLPAELEADLLEVPCGGGHDLAARRRRARERNQVDALVLGQLLTDGVVGGKLLGEGTFGRVYLATDPMLKRQVAIKTPGRVELTIEFRELFLREVAAASIHHPNVCPVYDAGVEGDSPYIGDVTSSRAAHSKVFSNEDRSPFRMSFVSPENSPSV